MDKHGPNQFQRCDLSSGRYPLETGAQADLSPVKYPRLSDDSKQKINWLPGLRV